MIKSASTQTVKDSVRMTMETINMQHTFDTPLIAVIRDSRGFMKVAVAVKLFFFLSTFYFVPGAQAVELAAEAGQARNVFHPRGRNDEEKLSNTLQAIKEHVTERKFQLDKRVREESGLWEDFLNLFGASSLAAEDLGKLQSMAQAAEQLHQKNLVSFAELEQELKAKRLSDVILQRHADAVNQYQAQYQQFREKLGRAMQAASLRDQDTALSELDRFLDKQQFKRRQQPFDPNNLPFGTPDPKKIREPVTDPQQLNRLLGLDSQPGVLKNIVDGVIKPAYAQTGNQPTLADLEPTIDVQITEAIQVKAAELNHNPVTIYNWVCNNIEFMPTYGSIQGSDMTLQTKRGNAFDTASLLIALFRASNIPARYVYGTVQIPVDQVMNWVGGAEAPEAAMSILGQGGIPNVGIIEGGRITHIKLEHVWAEAWVDFEPSRALKNIQGDSWVPMDASFKQYDYTDGIDIQQQVPFDETSFVQTIVDNAVIDEQAGSVQGIDPQYVQGQLTQYRQQVDEFINTQNPDATVGDVLGTKTIRKLNSAVLAGSLPYDLVARIGTFSVISDQLRHKYRFQLQDQYGVSLFSRTVNLPEIAGKTLALSFKPKTVQDEQTLRSYIPNDASQLPQNLPGYLIRMEAEWVVDGQAHATGTTHSLGEEVTLEQALYMPGFGWENASSHIVAGEYHAIGVDTGTTSTLQLNSVQTGLETAKAQLETFQQNGDESLLAGLTKHQLTGGILQTGVLSWFAINNRLDALSARQLGMIDVRLPSFGTFSTSARVEYSWGLLPRRVGFPGVVMDLDMIRSAVAAKDNDQARQLNYHRLTGVRYSAFEHIVPEQLFSTPESPAQGISAVKALTLAAAQGQTIYTLTQANSSQLNRIVIDANARAEIRDAINAGQQVTVHEQPINQSGWSGSGYIIFDPVTGSGAYKISGGANGGVLLAGIGILGIAIIGYAGVLAGAIVVAPMLLALALSLALHLIVLELIFNDDIPWHDISGSIFAIVGIVATAIGVLFPALGIAMAIVSILASVLGLI